MALNESVAWIAATLTGTAATGIAVVAVALFGMRMMAGGFDIRSGARIVVGLFLIFGAPAIAAALILAGSGEGRTLPGEPPELPQADSTPPQLPQTVCWTCAGGQH